MIGSRNVLSIGILVSAARTFNMLSDKASICSRRENPCSKDIGESNVDNRDPILMKNFTNSKCNEKKAYK